MHSHTSSLPNETYTQEQRTEMLRKMRATSSQFYELAIRTGVHSFIEFCGLMNEYIQVCERADKAGIDWVSANTHSGTALPFEDYNAAYLAEKLNCIYGPELLGNEKVRQAFISKLFEGEYKLVPTKPTWNPAWPKWTEGWRKVTSDDTMLGPVVCQECPGPAVFIREKGEGNNRRILFTSCLEHTPKKVLERLAGEK